ncbi:MAG: hypothetical protein WDW38_010084 [Sanguina aurantia]
MAPETSKAKATEECWKVLKAVVHRLLCLKGDQNFFLFSVNEEFDKAPGYYALITDPQDLATIYNRLDQQEYTDPSCVFQTPYDVHRAMLQVCVLRRVLFKGGGAGLAGRRENGWAALSPNQMFMNARIYSPAATHPVHLQANELQLVWEGAEMWGSVELMWKEVQVGTQIWPTA